MPVTYVANCDAPTAIPVGVTGGGTGGTGTGSTPPTLVTSTTKGVVGANIIGAAPGSIPAITMPSSVQVGNHLVALCISYTAVPVVNTAGGWNNVSAVSHTPSILDPAVAMAWKYFPAGGPQVETPFSAGGATDSLMAVWEVHGLDPTFTPNLHSTAFVSPNFGGSNVDLSDPTPAAGLYLFLAGQLPNSGDPGTGTLGFVGWTTDGSTHASGYGGVCAHIGYPTTPVSTVEQSLSFGAGASIAGILVGLGVSGVDSTGVPTTVIQYRDTSTFTVLKLNGVTVSTNPLSLNVVGDATMTDDGAGNITLTLANHGPYIDITAAAALAAATPLVSFQSGGAAVATNADATHQVDGYVLADVASSATARVFTSGVISGLSGLTPGARYFLGTGGALTTTAPTAAGTWIQEVGVAADATHLVFAPKAGTLNA